jgi:cardiolipin synthase
MNTRLFNNGEDGFDYIISAIDQAKSNIDIQMFIWRNDPIGQKVAKSVLAAAQRGVKINLSKDLIGGIFEHAEENKQSFFHAKMPRSLYIRAWCLDITYPMAGKPSGYSQDENKLVDQLMKHPHIKCDTKRLQYDHSKYFIVDDDILIISGMNIEFKEWRHDLLGRSYIDFLMAFECSKAVDAFRAAKASPLRQVDSFNLNGILLGTSELQFMMNRTNGFVKDFFIREGILQFINQARFRLDIVMAYIGDSSVLSAIERRVKEGLKVRFFLSKEANLQNDLNRKYALKLWKRCKGKLDIFLSESIIHGKLLCADDDLVTFGSANLNVPAMNRLGETNVCFRLSVLDQSDFYTNMMAELENSCLKVTHENELYYKPIKAFLEQLV